MSANKVAVRLARREVVRRPWRSLIVMLLVIAPVVVLSGFGIMVRTNDRSSVERFAARYGQADWHVDGGRSQFEAQVQENAAREQEIFEDGVSSIEPVPFDIEALRNLDANSTTLEFGTYEFRLKTLNGKRSWATITDLDVTSPVAQGITSEVNGRLPKGDGEVVLSVSLARVLGLKVGDTLELERPNEFSATVVGTIEWNNYLSRRAILVDPLASESIMARALGTEIDVPVTSLIRWDGPRNAEGIPTIANPSLVNILSSWPFESKWYLGGPYWFNYDVSVAQETIVWSWVGGVVAFTILGVVIAAAFAVTARRQLLLIGQLMGNGASVGTLRATLFLQGTVIGLLGALIGVGITLAGLHVFQPLVEQALNRRISGYDIRITDLVPIVLLATVASTVAAMIPARVAIRTSVLQALAGRRPVGAYPARLVARGAVAAAAGLLLLAVATVGASGISDGGGGTWLFVITGVTGALAVILGTCAMAPGIISKLEPLAAKLRGTSRLAARSVARQRTRAGAVVAAVAVVAAGAVAGSTTWLTADARSEPYNWSTPPNQVIVNSVVQYVEDDPDGDGTYGTSVPVAVPASLLAEVAAVVPEAKIIDQQTGWIPGVGIGDQLTDQERLRIFAQSDGVFESEPWQVVQIMSAEDAKTLGFPEEVSNRLASPGLIIVQDPYSGNQFEAEQESRELTVSLLDEHGSELDQFDAWLAFETMPNFYGIYASPQVAQDLGVEPRPYRVIFVASEPFDDNQIDLLQDIDASLWEQESGNNSGELYSWLSYGVQRWEPSNGLITTGIIAVATLFSLGVVALGLALSAAETKDERDVLVAIGARERTLRRLAGAKAAVLSGVGTVIGVPLGFIPTYVVAKAAMSANDSSFEVVFPWLQVALLVIVVPLVATAATGLASGISLRLRPVQASNMAFD